MDRLLSFAIFIVMSVALLALLYAYAGMKLRVSSLPRPWKRLAWILLFILAFLAPLSISLELLGAPPFIRDTISWISYVSLGFFTTAFLFWIARDVVMLLVAVKRKVLQLILWLKNSRQTETLPNPERRKFILSITNAGILGTSGIISAYGAYEACRRPDIVKVKIAVNQLPDNLKGFHIVQITDIHAGPTIKRNFIEGVVLQVNGLNPDVIVFTGDMVDGSVEKLKRDVEPFKALKAVHGAFFVTGNHEYYSGVEEWMAEVEQLGFKLLTNEHVILKKGASRVLLAGVPDLHGGRFLYNHFPDPEKAISGHNGADVKILLAHQPRGIEETVRAGYDLQLSGHTHGGQYFPFNCLIRLGFPYVAGLYRFQNTWIYVSRGTGYWGPPVRTGVPSEITSIQLIKNTES
jgi:predicted MPP superfamily phosphohydrolase